MKKHILKRLYIDKKLSVKEMSERLSTSEGTINYWMKKYDIQKRSISDAIYRKRNPTGDPFKFKTLQTNNDFFLYGLGMGLYWGEGTKANKLSIRLGNTDPGIILYFLKFLKDVWKVSDKKIKFGLQIFNDSKPEEALIYWIEKLNVKKEQFQKIIVTKPRGSGTYTKKIRHGVLTIYVHNKKLREGFEKELQKIIESI